MMVDRVRVALVGLGDIGLTAHLPALLRQPAVEVAALVDPVAERREKARAALGAPVPTLGDLAEVLRDDRIPALVLATPPWITTDLTVQALAAGRYVLAEKPVATSVARAAPLRALPPAQRARLQIGLTYRHDPALALLRDWITGGRLGGGPLLVRAHIYDERRDPADPEHTARLSATLAHGVPVLHEGSHVFDWLAHLLGRPAVVRDAWAVRTAADLPAPNLVGGRLDYPDGTVALTEFGWLTGRLPCCELAVLGDRGQAVLDVPTFRLTLSTVDESEAVELPGDRTTRCFDRQLARFLDLVTGRDPVPAPGVDDGIDALTLSEQMARMAAGP